MTLLEVYKKHARLIVVFSLFAVSLSYFWPYVVAAVARYSEPRYSIRILSYDPLLIHLEGFISRPERFYLSQLG